MSVNIIKVDMAPDKVNGKFSAKTMQIVGNSRKEQESEGEEETSECHINANKQVLGDNWLEQDNHELIRATTEKQGIINLMSGQTHLELDGDKKNKIVSNRKRSNFTD